MSADFFKYFSARLALSYLFFMLFAFGAMYFEEGKEYPDYFLYILLFCSFATSSALLSHLGKWRFNALMVDAQECDITRYFQKGEVLFEKLLILTDSFHFLPGTAERLRERVYKEYSRFLLALDTKSEKALTVHKKAYEYGWENLELKAKLISGFLKKKNLDRDEVGLGIKLIAEKSDNVEFLDLLVKNCLSKRIKDYDAQEVFRQALEKESRFLPRILDMILPGILDLERSDPFAVEIYFKAVEIKHQLWERCRKLLLKFARLYLFDKEIGKLEKRLVDYFNSTSSETGHTSVLEKVPFAFSTGMAKKKSSTAAKRLKKLERKTSKGHRIHWRVMLPDATFFYTAGGILLVVFLGYQSYQKNAVPALKQIREPLSHIPLGKESHNDKIRKYVHFKSDYPFTIQVGAFNSIEKAEQAMNKLRKESKIVYWLSAKIGNKEWFRVRIGEFNDRESARLFAKELEKKKLVGKDYYLTNFREGFILNHGYTGR